MLVKADLMIVCVALVGNGRQELHNPRMSMKKIQEIVGAKPLLLTMCLNNCNMVWYNNNTS
jgi:hypothetical protein